MKIGLVFSVQSLTGDWRQICQDVIEQVVLAEGLGFELVFISEHHLVDNGYFSSVITFCSSLATVTSRIRLGTAIVLLPLHHPFAVAEDTAVVDNLSKGWFIVGSPEDLIRESERYAKELRTRHFIFRIQFPGTPHNKVMKAIRLLGEEVMPHFAAKA